MAELRAVSEFSAKNVAGALGDRERGAVAPTNRALQAELRSLAGEKDPEIFYAELYRLGRRAEQRHPEFARRVFDAVAGQVDFRPLAERARNRLAALEGRGEIGAQSEILLARFAKEAIAPEIIIPMIAGSAVYGAVRTAVASRLIAGTGLASRGLGLGLTSGAAGYLAEVPSFVLAARALRPAAEASAGIAPSFGLELAQSALTLGVLKLAGLAGRSWLPRLPSEAPTFAGLLLAHRLESRLGLRPETAGANAILEALAATLSLGAGARLGRSLLGANFARFQAELEWRSRPQPPSFGGESRAGSLAFAAAGTAPGGPKATDHLFAMSQGSDPAADPKYWGENLKGGATMRAELLPLLDRAANYSESLKKAIPELPPDRMPGLAILLRALQARMDRSPEIGELVALYHSRLLKLLARPGKSENYPALLESLSVLGDLAELQPAIPSLVKKTKVGTLEQRFYAAALAARLGDADSWKFLARNLNNPLARSLLSAALPPATDPRRLAAGIQAPAGDPLYPWLAHPMSEVRDLALRLLRDNPAPPQDEAKALSHLAMAIAEEKISVQDSNLPLLRKLEDLHFDSPEFETIFRGIAGGMSGQQFERFVKNLAPLYRHEAGDFKQAVEGLKHPKKADPEFLRYWDRNSGADVELYHAKTAQARSLRWRRSEAGPENAANRALLYGSLLQSRDFSPAALKQRAGELGMSYLDFLEDKLPFALDGLGLLGDRKIELGSGLAYIPTSRLVFRPYHCMVERSKTRKIQRQIERSGALPSIDVLELPNGDFLIEEGHHRSTAAFFAGAGFVKARLAAEGETTLHQRNVGPFRDGKPVPLRWIVVDDELYHQHNALFRATFMPKLILGPENK